MSLFLLVLHFYGHTHIPRSGRLFYYIAPIVPLEVTIRSIIYAKTRTRNAYRLLVVNLIGTAIILAIVIDALFIHP
jgi:hypothetical protein